MSTLTVYSDADAGSVVIETNADGTLGAFFPRELQAVGNGDGTIGVVNIPKSTDEVDFFEVENVAFSAFVDQQGDPLGVDEVATVNAMNAIFADTGGADALPPVITSPLSATVADGDLSTTY